MRAVLISIRPKWCELIASGEKTIEVRKSKPKLETPFKCYIYCTNGFCSPDGDAFSHGWRKQVIGEFMCDKIGEAHWMQDFGYAGIYKEWDDVADCLTNQQIYDYMGKNDILFGWHISELKIYDKPNELSVFEHPCTSGKCPTYEECGGVDGGCVFAHHIRPPQSWCYVEELSERSDT